MQCGAVGLTGVYGYSAEVVISDDPFDDKHSMVLKICDAGGFALFGSNVHHLAPPVNY